MLGIYVGICVAIGKLGEKRKIGFTATFTLSLLLSPLIGLLAALLSKDLAKEQREQKMLQTQEAMLSNMTKGTGANGGASVSEEIKRLQTMKEEGLLTEEEYALAKKKVLAVQ